MNFPPECEEGNVEYKLRVWVGPYSDGKWVSAVVKSIHPNRTLTESAKVGNFVATALDKIERVKKGMVLFRQPLAGAGEVVADVLVLRRPTVIRARFSGVFHYKAIRADAYIKEIDEGKLMVGDSGVAKIGLTRPWHIDGGVFIFRNGPTRILGRALKAGDGASSA